MSTITKAVLTESVYRGLPSAFTKAKAREAVDTFFAKLSSEILSRDSLLLSGLGRFDRKRKSERIAQIPGTGRTAKVTERVVVTFASTGKLRRALNGAGMFYQPSVRAIYINDKPHNPLAESVAAIIMKKVADAILEGDRVEIRGFGAFSVRDYPGYTGRNPKTGEKVAVGPKKLPFFKAGRELLRRANA